MANTTMNVLFVLIFLLGIFAGIVVLQIFLSKKESKWPGLILPCISFGISVLAVLGILLFSAVTGTGATMGTTLIVDGEIVEQIEHTVTQISSPGTVIATAVYVFLLYNIPTAVLIAIYAACRGKRNRKRALEKMSVQDLE